MCIDLTCNPCGNHDLHDAAPSSMEAILCLVIDRLLRSHLPGNGVFICSEASKV